jgi:hypothetical protein
VDLHERPRAATRWSGCGGRAWCPALLEYLERNHQRCDVLIFFTYLYAPTALGVRIARRRASWYPTAHDRPAIRLEIYKELCSAPAGIAYNTEVERRFLTTHFSIRAIEEETVGCGVDLPQAHPYPRDLSTEAPPAAPEEDNPAEDEATAEDEASPTFRPHLAHRGSVFRRRHRLPGRSCSTAGGSTRARAARVDRVFPAPTCRGGTRRSC